MELERNKMVKTINKKSVTPLPNEFRNLDSMTSEERDARYSKLASADNPNPTITTTQIRGQSIGMNPVSKKTKR
jgi:hypothetical protein